MHISIKRSGFIFFFLLVVLISGKAQYYSSGQDPASVKWQQINTPNFQIIFPFGYEKQAQYLANIVDSAYALVKYSMNGRIKKTSIIIHNQTVISNGTTAWAPTRVDLYTTSPQQIYSQKWLDQLVLHEFRHLIQIEKLNTGLTSVLKFILGEQALALMTGVFIPQWFLEGDAVVTETSLGFSGRGRLPSFEMPIKAQLLEKGKFSYEKAVQGSFKDHVPGSYELGYLLVASGREKIGPGLWQHSLIKTGQSPFLLTPFSKAIKSHTGLSKQNFYHSVLDELKAKWSDEVASLNLTSIKALTKTNKFYTNYRSPILTDMGIIAIKSGIDDVTRFVLIKQNGTEDIIYTPGPKLSDPISWAKGTICWSEVEFDARWKNRNYSVIKTFNLHTKEKKQLTRKSRLFSPEISHDGKQIVAVDVNINDEAFIVIIDAHKGSEIQRFGSPNGEFLINPSWSDDDRKIAVIGLNERGKHILILDLDTGKFEPLFQESFAEITHPRITTDHVYFTASYSGIDNIYSFNLDRKKIFRISSVKYGADDVFVDEQNNILYYSNYTANGYQLVSQELNPPGKTLLNEVKISLPEFVETYTSQEKGILKIDTIDHQLFETKRYYKASGLLNIHSWAPASINVNSYDIKPGFSLMSQDKLSTAFASMGYEYDLNESLGKYYFKYSYQGFYPIIDFTFDHGKRRQYYQDSLKNIKDFVYKETNFSTEIRVPVSLSKNRYYRGVQPSIKLKNSFLSTLPGSNFSLNQNALHTLNYRLYLYNQQRTSMRDLYPAWGQLLDVQYGNTPFQTENKSWILSAASVFYFPGIFKHHGIRLYNGYQKRQEGIYFFPQIVNYPRGFINRNDTELFRTSLNYRLPLCYPDMHLGSLFYLKRLKLTLFYDQAVGRQKETNTTYRSTGFEMNSDFHFFSLVAPIDLGFRFIYFPDQKNTAIEFLFSVDFSALY